MSRSQPQPWSTVRRRSPPTETLTKAEDLWSTAGMSKVLDDDKQQQILALGRVAWTLRRIEQATGAIWQDLVDDHGFSARYASVRRFVRTLRDATPAEARVVITTAPGEEGQVDYGDDRWCGTQHRQVPTGASASPDVGLFAESGAAADLALERPNLGGGARAAPCPDNRPAPPRAPAGAAGLASDPRRRSVGADPPSPNHSDG